MRDRKLEIALAHPRGTERRTLDPYRAALRDPAAYAALPTPDRDVIVAWAEMRRRIRARGVDREVTNLADPLIDAEALRAFVLEGERAAGGRAVADDAGDLIALVARMRATA